MTTVHVLIIGSDLTGTGVAVHTSYRNAYESLRLEYPDARIERSPENDGTNVLAFTVEQEGYETVSACIVSEPISPVPSRITV
jgi:hypothetical protein